MATSTAALTGLKVDAIDLLTADHRNVEKLFKQYERIG